MNKTREKCAWQILVKYYIILTIKTLHPTSTPTSKKFFLFQKVNFC